MLTNSRASASFKWLLSGVIFLFINGFFVARVKEATRPELAGVSAFFVLVLAAPSFWALKNWLGWKRAAVIVCCLGTFAVLLESFAVQTGFPYGHFSYGEKIGLKFFGVVPWTVPFAWSPLVLGAAALAARRSRASGPFLIGITLFLLCFDGVLDPGAVQQGFWRYAAGGWYYGVPFSNFVGWILSGFLGALLLWYLSGKRTDVPVMLVSSVALILGFWTSVALFVGMWLPAALGLFLLGWILGEVRGSIERDKKE